MPDWVPEQYKRFFHKHVDERPGWEQALNYLSVYLDNTGPAFALVAGVSKYPKMGGRAADLWPARLDVQKMVAYLEMPPESFNEIVVLLDEDMTAENLGYFLTQYFPRRLSETRYSRFLFAYSGHGMTASNGRGYILTSQASSLDDRFNAGISLATLRAQFQEIVDTGHQVLALINACYGVDFHRLSLAFGRSRFRYRPGRAPTPSPLEVPARSPGMTRASGTATGRRGASFSRRSFRRSTAAPTCSPMTGSSPSANSKPI